MFKNNSITKKILSKKSTLNIKQRVTDNNDRVINRKTNKENSGVKRKNNVINNKTGLNITSKKQI